MGIENVQALEALIKEESIKRGLHYSALPKEDMNAPAFKSLLDYLNNLQLIDALCVIGMVIGLVIIGYSMYRFSKDKMELPLLVVPALTLMILLGLLGGLTFNDREAYMNSALIENEMFYEITNGGYRRTPVEWVDYKKNIRDTFGEGTKDKETHLDLSPLGTIMEGSSNRTVSHYLFRYILFNLDETSSFLGDKEYYDNQKAAFSDKVLPKAKLFIYTLGTVMTLNLAYIVYLSVNRKKHLDDDYCQRHFIWGAVVCVVGVFLVQFLLASYNSSIKDYYDVAGRNLLEAIQSLKH